MRRTAPQHQSGAKEGAGYGLYSLKVITLLLLGAARTGAQFLPSSLPVDPSSLSPSCQQGKGLYRARGPLPHVAEVSISLPPPPPPSTAWLALELHGGLELYEAVFASGRVIEACSRAQSAHTR